MTDVTRRGVLRFAMGAVATGSVAGIVFLEVTTEGLDPCDEQRSQLGGVRVECENGSDAA